jgi:hypothetical protein
VQSMAATNYSPPVAISPCVDEQTSQTNFADLMVSQLSSEEIAGAYARAENRCVESISRCPSPAYSQYSNYSSECPTPTSPTFTSDPFGSSVALSQTGTSQNFGYGSGDGGSYAGSFSPKPSGYFTSFDTGGWAWGGQVFPQTSDPFTPSFSRSRSCRW